MASSGAIPLRPPAPQGAAVLEMRLGELHQIFDSMDPAPFRERDLDPKANDYIVEWAEELPKQQPLALVVQLSGHVDAPGAETVLRDAVHEYFRGRAVAKRRELAHLFRTGRVSLVIGLAFLGMAIAAGEALATLISKESWGGIARESLVIGGWVALWRPLEIFLYDWWPLRARARLYDRLAAMDVSLHAPQAAA